MGVPEDFFPALDLAAQARGGSCGSKLPFDVPSLQENELPLAAADPAAADARALASAGRMRAPPARPLAAARPSGLRRSHLLPPRGARRVRKQI